MDFVPISEGVIQPIIRSNIQYVNSIEEFEQIELEPNETALRFDNYVQCFYIKKRDALGEYSPTKIFFYNDFAQKIQNYEEEEFIKKCKNAKLDELKTEIAIKFFLKNETPQQVWLWLIETKGKSYEWDYVKTLKHRLKVKLFENVIK